MHSNTYKLIFMDLYSSALVTKLIKNRFLSFYAEIFTVTLEPSLLSNASLLIYIPTLPYNQSTPASYQHRTLKHLLWLIWHYICFLWHVLRCTVLPRPCPSIFLTANVI